MFGYHEGVSLRVGSSGLRRTVWFPRASSISCSCWLRRVSRLVRC